MPRIIQPDGYIKGDTTLFIGSEKTALIDTGMEYCSPQLVEDLKKELGDRPLDYILLTHSHYDHVCGVPALRHAWPDVVVCAHPHAAKILAKESVRQFMMGMSAQNYEEMDPEHEVVGYPLEDYKVDLLVTEGSKIDLGDICFRVIETPGHTKCSVSYYDEINQILFASESTGIACTTDPFSVEPTYVSSFVQSMESIRKLKDLPVKKIVQSHRIIEKIQGVETYFERAETFAQLSCEFILSMHRNGLDPKDILKIYADVFAKRVEGQPIYAFLVNAEGAIKTVIRESEALGDEFLQFTNKN
ncbi:MAG: MBL fold metallo-hydrolase [Eubacteriales bacterium]|nr:MBL fold metallo-hydrolase [Eubacteriales bacterium]